MTIPDRDLEYLISNYKSGFSYYDVAEVNKAYGCVSGKYFRSDSIPLLLNYQLSQLISRLQIKKYC